MVCPDGRHGLNVLAQPECLFTLCIVDSSHRSLHISCCTVDLVEYLQ